MPQNSLSFQKFFGALVLTLASSAALAGAGTSLMQSAPVKATESYEATLQTDVIFNRGGGLNLSPHFRTGLVDHFLDLDAYIGGGKTQFMAGTLFKYNLLPDIDDQVGLSFLGGVAYLRDDHKEIKNRNMILITTGVLVSKRLEVSFGGLSPYGAFLFESLFAPTDSYAPLSLVAGAKWEFEQSAPWTFYSEFNLSVKDSLNALSAGAAYAF